MQELFKNHLVLFGKRVGKQFVNHSSLPRSEKKICLVILFDSGFLQITINNNNYYPIFGETMKYQKIYFGTYIIIPMLQFKYDILNMVSNIIHCVWDLI